MPEQRTNKLRLVLGKAKYTRRWRGKDGKWNCEYLKPTSIRGKRPDKHATTFIPAPNFNAEQWAKEADNPNVTVDTIIERITNPEVLEKIHTTEQKLKNIKTTTDTHKIGGQGAASVYYTERAALHTDIIREILSDDKIKNATPAPGTKPTVVFLGGRGGSGKSWFKGKVYDPDKNVVLDADYIKSKLPEYAGWNAAEVHEESSDILEKVAAIAKELKLNVVVDATLKSTGKAMRSAQNYKAEGYSLECHYMHLPRDKAAERAVNRFAGPTGRYVPIDVVLSNTTNESTFEALKSIADKWSFRDNSTDPPPTLISQSAGGLKSLQKAKKDTGGSKMDIRDMYDFGDVVDRKDYSSDVKAFIASKKPKVKVLKPSEIIGKDSGTKTD